MRWADTHKYLIVMCLRVDDMQTETWLAVALRAGGSECASVSECISDTSESLPMTPEAMRGCCATRLLREEYVLIQMLWREEPARLQQCLLSPEQFAKKRGVSLEDLG